DGLARRRDLRFADRPSRRPRRSGAHPRTRGIGRGSPGGQTNSRERGNGRAPFALVNIFFTPRARARIREVDAWWRAHRPEAPNLFEEELEAAQLHIASESHLSSPWRVVRGMLIRRVLLETTRQWLYYSV